MSYYCYLLYTDEGHTYIGATVDPERRLRQHNHELVGGARRTGIQVARGQTWKRACLIEGIPDWRSALQLEWKWKQLGRTRWKNTRHPMHRRIQSLWTMLNELDRPTSSALPYAEYPAGVPPTIQWEDGSDPWRILYEQLSSASTSRSSSTSLV